MKPKKRKIVNAIDTYETRYGTMKPPKRSKELEEIVQQVWSDGHAGDHISEHWEIKKSVRKIEKWAKEKYGV